MNKWAIIYIFIFVFFVNNINADAVYSRNQTIKIINDIIRLTEKSHLLWNKAQKDSLYLKEYKDFCEQDSLNILDSQYEDSKVFDTAKEIICIKKDTTLLKLYLKLILVSENSADEHRIYVLGEIFVKQTEMVKRHLSNIKSNKEKNIIYRTLLYGFYYVNTYEGNRRVDKFDLLINELNLLKPKYYRGPTIEEMFKNGI